MTTCTITGRAVLLQAAGLLSDDAENSEYDRAIVELTCHLLGISTDDRDAVTSCLRELHG